MVTTVATSVPPVVLFTAFWYQYTVIGMPVFVPVPVVQLLNLKLTAVTVVAFRQNEPPPVIVLTVLGA